MMSDERSEKREGGAMADTGKRRAGIHVRLSFPNGGSLDVSDVLPENLDHG